MIIESKTTRVSHSVVRMLLFLCVCFLFVPEVRSGTTDFQQSNTEKRITVTGTVLDENQEPLVGVTVSTKDGKGNTVTDIDGKFTIQTASNAVLVMTYLGMDKMEVPVKGRTHLTTVMKSNQIALSDVVVIGYGKQSKATLTSAITKVDSKDMAISPSGNPMSMLQGKVPGMQIRVNSGQPGSNPQIIVRGGTTTSPESDAPLVIIDGVIRMVKDINYSDIETIQVLKDAASTAIYGSKASRGIIMITTKQGKVGKGTLSFKYGLSIDNQPKLMPLSNAREYLTATRFAALHANNPGKYLNGTFGMSTNNVRNTLTTTAFLDDYITKYGQDYVENLLTNQGWEIMEDPATPGKMLIFKDTDFQKNLFQTAVNHDYNLTFSGGNDRSTFYTSLGYLTQDGIVVGSNYDRWSFLTNASYKIFDNLKVKSMLNYSIHNSRGINEKNVISRASKMPPTIRQWYEDGTPAPGELTSSFRTRQHEIYYQEQENKVSRLNLAIELDWELLPSLHLKPMFSFTNNEGKDHNFERYNEVVKNRPVYEAHNMDLHYQYDLVLNYNKSFAQKHNFDFMLGGNYIYDSWYRFNGSGYGGTSDYIETLNGIAAETAKTTSKQTYKKMSSYFGRVNYNYDMKYLFSASLRYDGSSHFAANHKYAMFPGISAGWNIHRENFFKPYTNVINNLKLRASWGKTGYDNLSLSNTEGSYAAGHNYGGEAGILNDVLMNRDLLWEETISTNVGFDLGLFNNRLMFSADAYTKTTNNRLIDEKLWSETGFSSIKSNFGSLNTKGLEFTLSAVPVQTHDFNWTIDANFTIFRTVISKLPNNGADKNRTGGGIIFDPILGKYIEVGGFAEGERFGARFAYQLDGVYATDEDAANAPYDEGVSSDWLGKGKKAGDAIWRDVDHNGIINSKDMVFVGYLHPDKLGGLSQTFSYKKFRLRFVTDFSMGNVIDNQFRAQANANSRNNYATIHDVASNKMWHKPGDVATIPRYDVESDWDNGKRNHGRPNSATIGFKGGSVNTLYIKKGDYLAFRELSLSYLLETNWLKAIKISRMDFSAAVYNLGYWTAYDGLTPEVIGADAGKYARPRQFLFTVNLTF